MRILLLSGLLLALGLAGPGLLVPAPAWAGDEPPAALDPDPDIVVHVPADHMDVLLDPERRGVVLRHEEYVRLLEDARQTSGERGRLPPVAGALVSATGTLDLTTSGGASLDATYLVRVLASGPSIVAFPTEGLAVVSVTVDGEGRYEELDGAGRLRFDGPGDRTVRLRAFADVVRQGDRRMVRARMAPAAATALRVVAPSSSQGAFHGEGAHVEIATPAGGSHAFDVTPDRGGRWAVSWEPASRGTEGPSVLDADVRAAHGIEDGLIRSRILVIVDVLRTPATSLDLEVPADLALRAVTGKGMAGSSRSEDRTRLRIDLAAETRGRMAVTLVGETPYRPQVDLELPRVVVVGAVRQRGTVTLDHTPDVDVHDVRVVGGRRLASRRAKGRAPLLQYALARADASVRVDVAPGDVRVEASSTYYLNLTEPARTLIAVVAYAVTQGTAYELRPRFPAGYALRTLDVDGVTGGFRTEEKDDGLVEVRLEHGVRKGQAVRLVATLEEAEVDWVPEAGNVLLGLSVPSAGADREEGFVGVGADASFRVLDAELNDLVSVGAAELTSRGVSPAGLVYGYRLDGPAPSVALTVERRVPRLDASVIAHAQPSPRRLLVDNLVVHTVERAGVRALTVDVPTWARDVVRIEAPDLVSAVRDEDATDVPTGFDRWAVTLGRRVLGRHLLMVRYWEDQDVDDWSLPVARPLAVRVPLERVVRTVVVGRAAGLEVGLEGGAPADALAELPPEARIDALSVREVVRLLPEMEGPGISVRRHDGAPVLDAIARSVRLETAVAREGILRTRAHVVLVNIGLQFLRVALPEGSELIGAVVDGESVKPLSEAHGVLLIPVPPARRARSATRAVLTYETHLGREALGEVEIPSPDFPGLEVLETRHTVAFDPGDEIRALRGDYGGVVRRRTRREPWILSILSAPLGASFPPLSASSEARGPARASTPAQAGSDDAVWADSGAHGDDPVIDASRRYTTELATSQTLQREVEELDEMDAEEAGGWEDSIAQRRPRDEAAVRDAVLAQDQSLVRLQAMRQQVAEVQRLNDQVQRARHGYTDVEADRAGQQGMPSAGTVPAQTLARPPAETRSARPPSPEPAPGDMPPVMLEPSNFTPPSGALPPADVFARPLADPAAPGAGGPPRIGQPAPGGEGPGATPQPTAPPPRAPRRKGLLSLDVPVLLSSNVIRAQRLGGGGSMIVTVATRADGAAGYWFQLILAFTAGLALAVRSRVAAWTVPLAGIALAILTTVVFARAAGSWPTALVDATTALVGVLALRALVRAVLLRRVAGAAVLVLAIGFGASSARADEVAAEPEVEPPTTVYVPYDPKDPDVPRSDDRVFLPLDVYLRLRRLAHPEEDPDVLAKGRVATLLEAAHSVHVGLDEAQGEMRLTFAKRGEGLTLVPLRLGGLAVSTATLDGTPTPLLMQDGLHHVPLEVEGDHEVVLAFRAPVLRDALGRRCVFDVPTFVGASLDVTTEAFDGEIRVAGAGQVMPAVAADGVSTTRVHLGGLSRVALVLEDPQAREIAVALRTRAESRSVHSIRDGGTETRTSVTLHVLQGEASHVDLDLPAGLSVLSAGGPAVARWEVADGRLRLVFAEPQTGRVEVVVVVARDAAAPTRDEILPTLAVRDSTGERGVIVVNADPFLRVEPAETAGLLRTSTPRDKASRGSDGAGRVAGAWHFAAQPTRFTVRVEEAEGGLVVDTVQVVVFGEDHVRTRISAVVGVDARVPTGDLVFDVPGDDEVRGVTSRALASWWTEGAGESRTLHLRYDDLKTGDLPIHVRLDRRLGGVRDAVAVPRWHLRGAKRDRGRLYLYALSDLDPDPGRSPGLRSVPLTTSPPAPPEANAVLRRAFVWEEAPEASLPVTLRTPSLEVEGIVVSSVHPGDEAHRLEHLVLFDVRRGAADRFDVFVPDAGMAPLDVVRTRDLREVRRRRVVRRGPEGDEVEGTLYEIRLQSARDGIVEVTISQLALPERPVRVVRPEQALAEGDTEREVKAVRWFGLVRTFLDGEVEVELRGEGADPAVWEDLPFLPTGLLRQDVLQAISARAPYVLRVQARRHRLQEESDAVVRAAHADAVLGRDGQVRVRASYRLFNRGRQFLRLRLPKGGVLFGATVAGRPVKPLEGSAGDLLVPVPKVPLGGAGYVVSLLYRAPAGARFPASDLVVQLPEVVGVEIDRTLVRLHVPSGWDVDVESDMTATEAADVSADLAEAAVREAKGLIDVAKGGTLEQRQLAAQNLGVLVAEANELNIRSGNKRVELDREVEQVQREFDENFKAVVQDLEAAGRLAQGQTFDVFASNAAPILEAGRSLQADAGAMGATVQQRGQAQWAYNPTLVEEGEKKQEIAQLKRRLGKALQERADQEIVDRQVEIAQASQPGNLVRGDGSEVVADATWQNFACLNGVLEVDQRKNRQLGVVAQAAPQEDVFFFGSAANAYGGPLVNLDDVTNGLEDQGSAGYDVGGGGLTTGAGLNPSSGIYFHDGSDGEFRARTENLFDGPLLGDRPLFGSEFETDNDLPYEESLGEDGIGDRPFDPRNQSGLVDFQFSENLDAASVGSGGGAGGRFQTQGRSRSGLMGVDVPLPRGGTVYHFRALRAGAPLKVTVTERGMSLGLRWLLFVVLLAGVGALGFAARRLWRSR